ncbi:hypothetical protein OSTOST_01247 [Ostertagia ostertagi]
MREIDEDLQTERVHKKRCVWIGTGSVHAQPDICSGVCSSSHEVDKGQTFKIAALISECNFWTTHLAELRYLASVCDEKVALYKVDDDAAWDVQWLSEFVKSNITLNGFFCPRMNEAPIRDEKSKW